MNFTILTFNKNINISNFKNSYSNIIKNWLYNQIYNITHTQHEKKKKKNPPILNKIAEELKEKFERP